MTTSIFQKVYDQKRAVIVLEFQNHSKIDQYRILLLQQLFGAPKKCAIQIWENRPILDEIITKVKEQINSDTPLTVQMSKLMLLILENCFTLTQDIIKIKGVLGCGADAEDAEDTLSICIISIFSWFNIFNEKVQIGEQQYHQFINDNLEFDSNYILIPFNGINDIDPNKVQSSLNMYIKAFSIVKPESEQNLKNGLWDLYRYIDSADILTAFDNFAQFIDSDQNIVLFDSSDLNSLAGIKQFTDHEQAYNFIEKIYFMEQQELKIPKIEYNHHLTQSGIMTSQLPPGIKTYGIKYHISNILQTDI